MLPGGGGVRAKPFSAGAPPSRCRGRWGGCPPRQRQPSMRRCVPPRHRHTRLPVPTVILLPQPRQPRLKPGQGGHAPSLHPALPTPPPWQRDCTTPLRRGGGFPQRSPAGRERWGTVDSGSLGRGTGAENGPGRGVLEGTRRRWAVVQRGRG